MFAEFSNDFIFANNSLVANTNIQVNSQVTTIYEVFRVISGYSLYLSDHLKRMEKSLSESGIFFHIPDIEILQKQVKELCDKNNKHFGNIEFRISAMPDGEAECYLGFIPHYYPEPITYIEGIAIDYIDAVRKNPSVKRKYTPTREKANAFLKASGQYEVLLVNENKEITEGSRSNVFFIKDSEIYTAPDNIVLSGITRVKVLNIIEKLHLKLSYQAINIKELPLVDAAFICGTSPGILPIKAIRNYNFDVKNKTLRQIIENYNGLISSFIANYKS